MQKQIILQEKNILEEKCLLIKEAAEKLFWPQELQNFNIKLKVFDAYRPKYVQEALWKFCPNADFLLTQQGLLTQEALQ